MGQPKNQSDKIAYPDSESDQEESKTDMAEHKSDVENKQLSSPDTLDMGWLLVGSGVIGALLLLIRRDRRIVAWGISAGLSLAGVTVLMEQRQSHIDQVEQRILEELDGLDPVAKAQVLKNIAVEEFDKKR